MKKQGEGLHKKNTVILQNSDPELKESYEMTESEFNIITVRAFNEIQENTDR